MRFNPAYLPGWVHEDICFRLEKFSRDVAEKKSPRLGLFMPPRHGKSEIVSRNFPAWHLGQYPQHEYIACSYNLDLARTFSRKVKSIIESPDYAPLFPNMHPDTSNWSSEEWMLLEGGGYVAAGVGGGVTGRGAHVLAIDDPIKNAEEADSAQILEKLWDWYGSTAYTRLAPGGGVLLIQTCWSDLDLAGRIQAAMLEDPEYDQFEIVKYPAVAEDFEYQDPVTRALTRSPTPLKDGEVASQALTLLREPGQALHPERYDQQKLHSIKKTLSARYWNALYQQNPVPDDGAYFKGEWLRTQPMPLREECVAYCAWDFAITERTAADYTVGSVILHDPDDAAHVVDVVRFRSGNAYDIADAILNTAKRWYTSGLIIGVEDGQIWRSIEAVVRRKMTEMRFYPPIEVLKPITDKQARARALQGRMQQGMISFLEGAQWYETVRRELLRFPAGANDDIVDSLAWNAQLLAGKTAPRRKVSKGLPSWRDRLKPTRKVAKSYMAA
jgi:predicted phage terminase large subunit-like protein